MSNASTREMLSLGQLYFYTKQGDTVTYRFQWSTSAFTEDPMVPEISYQDDYDGDTRYSSDYYSYLGKYNYLKSNLDDGTGSADSFIFRLYDKETGALITEQQVSGTSVDLALNDGDYLWEVAAVKNGTVIKTSERSRMTADIQFTELYGGDYDMECCSAKFYVSQNYYGGNYGDDFGAYNVVGGAIENRADESECYFLVSQGTEFAFMEAENEGYTFSSDGSFSGFHGEFNMSDNCLFSHSGIYVYENGSWNYKMFCSTEEGATTGYAGTSDMFVRWEHDEQELLRYNVSTGAIERVLTADSPLESFSSKYYASQTGVYTIADGSQILAYTPAGEGDSMLWNDCYMQVVVKDANGNVWECECDEIPEGGVASVVVRYFAINGNNVGAMQEITLSEGASGVHDICPDDFFSTRIGNCILFQNTVWDSEEPDEFGWIVHAIENGVVQEKGSFTFDQYMVPVLDDGNVVVHDYRDGSETVLYSNVVFNEPDLDDVVTPPSSGGVGESPVTSGGVVEPPVSSGGVVEPPVSSGGTVTPSVSSGTTSSNVVIDEVITKDKTITSGGKISNKAIAPGANIFLKPGAASIDMVISSGAALHVYSGATTSNTVVKRYGGFGIGDGATAIGTTIDWGGEVTVWGGGTVNDNQINEWGAILLKAGAVASNTVVESNGALHVYSGAVASSTFIKQGGGFGIGDGATAFDTVVDVAGAVTVWGGGLVQRSQIKNQGAIILLDGAGANETVIHAGGALHIYAGATAFSTEITTGAGLGIGGDGTLYGSILESGASMTFYDGSHLRAWNTIEGNIYTSGGVDAEGASLHLVLDNLSAGAPAMIDNIANFYNVQRYSVDVSRQKEYGTYQLAGGAWSFDAPITFYLDGVDCGVLTLGSTLEVEGIEKAYTFKKENGMLLLEVD